jgi:predicted phage terminase large subunit-like protein
MLPMRFEPDRKCFTCIGFEDPRTEPGELLCADRFDDEVVADMEKRLGSYGAAGQLQQRPSPEEGGIFKKNWWRFWVPAGVTLSPVQVKLPDGSLYTCHQEPLPDVFTEQLQSWDMAIKDTASSAYVVGQVWARLKANKYLLDQDRDKRDMPGTLQAVRDLSAKWPRAHKKLVEDKANGPAVIQMLRTEIPGLIAVDPHGDKVARAKAISPEVEAGNYYLPHPAIAPWVKDLIEECANFPNSTYKDQVDTLTQAGIRMMADENREKSKKPRSHSSRSLR